MLTMNPKIYWLVSLVCLAAISPAAAHKDDRAEGAFGIVDAPVFPFVGEEPVSTKQSDFGESILSVQRESRATPRKNKSAEARIVRERLERIQHLVEAADSLADTFISGGTVRGLALKMMVSAALRKRKK